MTEADALGKWCPFARGDSIARERVISYHPQETHNRCIGSACMAWREIAEEQDKPSGGIGETHSVVIGGFCGLAGQP